MMKFFSETKLLAESLYSKFIDLLFNFLYFFYFSKLNHMYLKGIAFYVFFFFQSTFH